MEHSLFIPVILGTARQGRESEHVARLVFEQTKKRAEVETELIDVRELPLRLDDAGEQMKDPAFSATIERCDGVIIVTPEYNHGYPGLNYVGRVNKFLDELIWMSRVLRHGRENIPPV